MKEVQYISDFRRNGKKLEFKVKWKMLPETQSEWLSFDNLACDKNLACDEEVLNSFKSDYLEQFLSCTDDDDYKELFPENISFRSTFARLKLLVYPKDFIYKSAYKAKKNEMYELIEKAEIQLNGNQKNINIENEVDLEQFPSDIKWCHDYRNLKGEISEQCKCEGSCLNDDECCYPSRYTLNGKLKDVKDNSFIYECNSFCKCEYNSCHNRVVQKGSNCSLCIFKTTKKGWGVKTLEDIEKGTYISEYCGEIITNDVANQRGEIEDYKMTYFLQMNYEYTIDATKMGNEARFFNHSSAPNMDVFHVKHFVLKYERLAFFATEDIEKGQELTWDYSWMG